LRLAGGFVVPPDVELNPVDNEHNRRILVFIANNPDGVRKICAK
jgi:ribulose bisphosphate carboxylase small subunit